MQYLGRPGWIEHLLTRLPWTCVESKHVLYRLKLMKKAVQNAVADEIDGAQRLGSASLEELKNEDPHVVVRALSCLFVVGSREDEQAVGMLSKHPDQQVRKAARSCLFEMRRRDA